MTNKELQKRKNNIIARGQGNLLPIFIKKGVNSELWDEEDNRYIDFGAGIAVANTGHSNPKVVEAVKEQVTNFSHTCVMVTPYKNSIELAEKIVKKSPIKNAKSIFVTTGAEAVENAIKISRAATNRPGIIAFNGGFHGRTNLCMGLTGKVAPYKNGYGPFPNDIYHAPYPIEYHGISVDESIKYLSNIFKVSIEPEKIAAIIIEPVQGEGGFYEAPKGFLQKLRDICDQYGILLIVDEIQTGFGRTGSFFASEKHNIEPDLITMAKGLAGGYPLAAVVGKSEIMDKPLPGGLGGTYAGSPVSCAAALAVLDIIEENNLVSRAIEIGETVVNKLSQLQIKYPMIIGDIRNSGAMIACELIENGNSELPNTELTKNMVSEAAKNGLILLSCGARGNVIRILTPLTIEQHILEEGLDIFEKTFISLLN
ncbi:MAG: 4-aminobutyrate--2-oxoglutarate transaminase [Gammaproteobacteria bacterium]|nr:4-aminobutyrate--2-oxoglutarate transaminase [Gammaproteobacteria bacterium]